MIFVSLGDFDMVFFLHFLLCYYIRTPHAPYHLAINLESKQSVLFVPQLGGDYSMWCGAVPSLEEFKKATGIESARYSKEIA